MTTIVRYIWVAIIGATIGSVCGAGFHAVPFVLCVMLGGAFGAAANYYVESGPRHTTHHRWWAVSGLAAGFLIGKGVALLLAKSEIAINDHMVLLALLLLSCAIIGFIVAFLTSVVVELLTVDLWRHAWAASVGFVTGMLVGITLQVLGLVFDWPSLHNLGFPMVCGIFGSLVVLIVDFFSTEVRQHIWSSNVGFVVGGVAGVGLHIAARLVLGRQGYNISSLLNGWFYLTCAAIGAIIAIAISTTRRQREASRGLIKQPAPFSYIRFHWLVSTCCLLVIVSVAFFIRIHCFTGMRGMDDVFYTELAYATASGNDAVAKETMPPVFRNRWGVILPAALSVKIFGTSEAAFLLYPFAISIGGILLAFFIARHFFGDLGGLFAATMFTFLPWDIHMATGLFPDVPAAFWANLGVFLCLIGPGRSSNTMKSALGWCAGICFGFSWLHKGSVVYLVPLVGIFLLYQIYKNRSNIHLLIGAAVGSLMILIAEMETYFLVHGDVAHRFVTIEENWQKYKMYFFVEGSKRGWKAGNFYPAVSARLIAKNPRAIFLGTGFAYLTTAATLITVWAGLFRKRQFMFSSLWFLLMVVMFNFCSTSMSSYMPLVIASKRYVYAIMMPAVVITAGLLAYLTGRAIGALVATIKERSASQKEPATQEEGVAGGQGKFPIEVAKVAGWIVATLVAFFLVAEGYTPGVQEEFKRKPSCLFVREAVKHVSPTDNVYTDRRSRKLLRFFWGFPDEMNIHVWNRNLKANRVPKGAYVVVWTWRIRHEQGKFGRGKRHPDFTSKKPPTWELVEVVDGLGRVYRAR